MLVNFKEKTDIYVVFSKKEQDHGGFPSMLIIMIKNPSVKQFPINGDFSRTIKVCRVARPLKVISRFQKNFLLQLLEQLAADGFKKQ